MWLKKVTFAKKRPEQLMVALNDWMCVERADKNRF